MNYKFFTNSEKTWQAMCEAVTAARRSIYMEMYMLEGNLERFNIFELLKTKSKEGLRVKIVVDSLGSRDLGNGKVKELKESGVEIFFTSHLFYRTHRKILIIDETIAFVGGVNFSDSAKNWKDLTVKIQGKLVKYIIRSFAKVYGDAGGKDREILSRRKKSKFKIKNHWLVENFPGRKNFNLKHVYKDHLRNAKQSIVLVTPYFAPKRWFIKGLKRAVNRGVKIDILLPRESDHFFADRVSYFHMFKLSKLGIKFYLYPEMNHAKAMLIDGREGMVGSQNIDFLSFEWNDEIGVFFEDPKPLKQLSEIIEKWKDESALFNPKTNKPAWSDYILSPVTRIFNRFI